MNCSLKLPLVAWLVLLLNTGSRGLIARPPIEAEQPAVASSRTVLSTFRVSNFGDLQYELSIAPCNEPACAFEVRLLVGGAPTTSLDLDWVKAHGPAAKQEADESSGAGDPLEPPKQTTAWSTGEEKDNVTIVARLVRLTPRLNGLLIDRRAGFDVLKRQHDLIVALNGKLVNAWSDRDGNGPAWSTIVLLETSPNTAQQILAFSGFRQPSNDLPDTFQFTAYRWNPETNKLEHPADGNPPVHAVIVGNFKSAVEAHAAQEASDCFNGFWVLHSNAFLKLRPGAFVLAAVSTKKLLVLEKARAVKSCARQSSISVIESFYQP